MLKEASDTFSTVFAHLSYGKEAGKILRIQPLATYRNLLNQLLGVTIPGHFFSRFASEIP